MMLRNFSLSERRKLQGTSKQFKNASLAAGASWYKDLESVNQLHKHLPMDRVTITNNNSEDIEFYPNDTNERVKLIVANSIQSFDKSALGGGLIRFRVVNVGAATLDADKVEIFVEKETPNTQSLVDTLARKFPRIFLR